MPYTIVMRPKPKVLLDIKTGFGRDPFKACEPRLNLSFKGRSASELRFSRYIVTLGIFAVAFYFAASAFAPIITAETFAETADDQKDQNALKEQLEVYEKEIVDLENTILEYNKKGSTLKSEIGILNTKIAKINLQIKAVNISISRLNNEVEETSVKITRTESNISSNKNMLNNTLQDIYLSDKENLVEILLKSERLSDFFGNVNSLSALQENLRSSLEDLVIARDELVDEKEKLDLQKLDAEALRAYQDSQKTAIQRTKSEKDTLLRITKGEESKFRDLVVEKKKAAAEIRSRIFRLLGGGELPFEEAVKIAKIAEKATNARAALILSVLHQESGVNGVIGKNLGRCYYNTPQKNASGTVMSNKQKPIFLAILAELGPNYDPATTPVSCPILRDGYYGGAMGPAQFMPTTWALYKDRVALITGGNPPNPFNNLDAFTATALYLGDGLQSCRLIYKTLFSQESCAAAKYYSGSAWRSYMSVGRYGYRVADRAQDFEKDIEVILLASNQ